MAVPKRRQSSSRSGKRRAHDALNRLMFHALNLQGVHQVVGQRSLFVLIVNK